VSYDGNALAACPSQACNQSGRRNAWHQRRTFNSCWPTGELRKQVRRLSRPHEWAREHGVDPRRPLSQTPGRLAEAPLACRRQRAQLIVRPSAPVALESYCVTHHDHFYRHGVESCIAALVIRSCDAATWAWNYRKEVIAMKIVTTACLLLLASSLAAEEQQQVF